MLDFLQKKASNILMFLFLIRLKSHDLENEEKILRIQNKNIKRLMKNAYKIPFYKQKFDAVGMKPEDFKTAEDLKKFPILTKDEIRNWILPEVNANPQKYKYWSAMSTSGSSGTPLTVYLSPMEYAKQNANWIRIGQSNGYKLRYKTFTLRDPSIIKKRNGKDSIIQRICIARRECLSSLCNGKEIYEYWNQYKPDYVYIQRSKLFQTLMYVEKHNYALFVPKLCVVIGEGVDKEAYLLFDKHLHGVFCSSYGSVETGACTFSRKGTVNPHIITRDTHAINIYQGRIVITNLFISGFPIINYDINDGGEFITLNGTTYLTNILGRTNDFLTLKNGTTVSYQSFYTIMEKKDNILQFRVIQETYSHIHIQLVEKNNNFDKEIIEQEITEEVKNIIPDNYIVLTYEWLEELEPDENGKRRFIISKVK